MINRLQLYDKPEYYKELADKPISKETIDERREEIVYICAYKVQNHVDRRYGSLDLHIREDMTQDVSAMIETYIEKYKPDKHGDFWAYMNVSIKSAAIKYYHKEVGNPGVSDYERREGKKARELIDNGMTLEEAASTLKHKKTTTESHLLASSNFKSTDFKDEDGHTVLDKLGTHMIDDYNEDMHNDVIINLSIKQIKDKMNMEENFIIDTYLEQKKTYDKKWKTPTFDICKRYGITNHRVKDVIKRFKKELKEIMYNIC